MTLTAPSPPSVAELDPETPVTVYERTRTGLPKFGVYFADVWHRRPLTWHLARTSLKGEHYDSVLGMVWLVLNPLLMAAVYLFVRTILMPSVDGDAKRDIIAHLIMGVFFFRFVAGCVGENAHSIKKNRQLVLNMGFPRLIFPISSVLKDFLEFLPVLVVFLVINTYLEQPITSALLYLPYVVIMLALFNLGVTMLCSPLPVLSPDGAGFLPYITKVWMYVTPVLFTVAEIPEGLIKWMYVNPLFPFFAALEQIFDGVAPSPKYLLLSGAWALGAVAVGLPTFLMKERKFAARL